MYLYKYIYIIYICNIYNIHSTHDIYVVRKVSIYVGEFKNSTFLSFLGKGHWSQGAWTFSVIAIFCVLSLLPWRLRGY